MNKYKVIDLFAGAGGLSNGFMQTGRFEIVGVVEINKVAIETYKYNHSGMEECIIYPERATVSDIAKIDFKKFVEEKCLNREELIVIGGPPCQGFSNANRQKNYLISGNNQLVKQYARVINEVRPVAFLMENVKTMHSDTHKFFATEHEDNTIYAYSSLEHLDEISKDKEKLYKEEKILLIRTTLVELESVIKELSTMETIKPFLTNDACLSRIRSVVRKLKKSFIYNPTTKKEIVDLERVEEALKVFEVPEFTYQLEVKNIIKNMLVAVRTLISKKNTDNAETLHLMDPFLTLNQYLRFMYELKEQQIIVLDTDFDSRGNVLKVEAKVYSYNIVKYLEYFFEYLGYSIGMGTANSDHFYVPQRRQRFMIMGVDKDKLGVEEVSLPAPYTEKPFTVHDAIYDLEKIEPTKNIDEYRLPYNIEKGITPLQKYFRKGLEEQVIFNHINTDSEELSKKRFKEIKEKNGKNFHSLSDELKNVTYSDSTRTQNTVYLRLNYDAPSPTVINVRKSMWQHPKKPVALSIREAARLQSFKDDFLFIGAKDKQYQQIGNAVPPLLARAVAEQMLICLGTKPKEWLKNEI